MINRQDALVEIPGSHAKEAVAFALLADRAVRGLPNTLPSVTGPRNEVIMGKISLPWKG